MSLVQGSQRLLGRCTMHERQRIGHWTKLEATLPILKSQGIKRQWTKLVCEPRCMVPKSDVRVLMVDALDEGTFIVCSSDSLPCIPASSSPLATTPTYSFPRP